MIRPSVQLFERVTKAPEQFLGDLTRHAGDWQRTSRDIGGFWTGDFTIRDTMGRSEMLAFYNLGIGRQIVEKTAGLVTWKGEIVQLELTLGGITYHRTLKQELWTNKAKVCYRDSATGETTSTAWAEVTASSDRYGESCYVDIVGSNYNATSAAAARDRRLSKDAFPRSRPAGGLSFRPGRRTVPNSLRVLCAGFVFSMNRRYRESDIATAAIETQIGALIDNSEFVTTGSIEANGMSVEVKCSENPKRLWDVVEDLVLMGDEDGNDWCGGVWGGRKFAYRPAETVVSHYWRNGRLTDFAGRQMIASMIKPGIVVQVTGAPVGITPPGGSVIDNPRNMYITEVEFTMPDQYWLTPYGGGPSLIGRGR